MHRLAYELASIETRLGVMRVECPSKRGAQIVAVGFDRRNPSCRVRSIQLCIPLFHEHHMPGSDLFLVMALAKQLHGKLADRLEHPIALVREAHKALLDERLQDVEVRAADLLGGFERAAARED